MGQVRQRAGGLRVDGTTIVERHHQQERRWPVLLHRFHGWLPLPVRERSGGVSERDSVRPVNRFERMGGPPEGHHQQDGWLLHVSRDSSDVRRLCAHIGCWGVCLTFGVPSRAYNGGCGR